MSDQHETNPYKSPTKDAKESPATGRFPTKIELLVIVAIICVLIGLLLPSSTISCNLGFRGAIASSLKQIGLAMHDYHDAHGSLPPAMVTDNEGRPLYSWRVLILPYMGEGNLYQQFALDEPWDSETNLPLVQQMPDWFADPTQRSSANLGETCCLAIVDPKSDRTMMQSTVGRRFSDVADGLDLTGMVVFEPRRREVWTKPIDIHPKELVGRPPLRNNEICGGLLLKGDASSQWFGYVDSPSIRSYVYCDDDSTN
ncbi:DUF1559 domain-containing protein [Bremerella cremea]|uniref:DUF1559 family PulG-like putative transporter n=1 Tax=Bremerella cremea TaxID=1031537 RepID=UPI0031EBBAEB